jgi:hypothetical protein
LFPRTLLTLLNKDLERPRVFSPPFVRQCQKILFVRPSGKKCFESAPQRMAAMS